MPAGDRTFDAALSRYRPMAKSVEIAADLVRLLEEAQPTWQSRVAVFTSMFDLIFTPDHRGPWDSADQVPVGKCWLRVRHQTRDSPPIPCFAFELFRRVAHPQQPSRVDDQLIAGDVCRIENARQVLDAYLAQITDGLPSDRPG